MKNFILFSFICIILFSCSSKQLIKNNLFIDNEYPVKVKIPENYTEGSGSEMENVRVWVYKKGYEDYFLFKPPSVYIKVIPKDTEFDEFIKESESNFYRYPGYWQYEQTHEFYSKIKNNRAKLIYFDSKSRPPSVNTSSTITYSNCGINAYIELENIIVVISYISFYRWYNEKDFESFKKGIEFSN